jgi:SAM-dependent methyltransferase
VTGVAPVGPTSPAPEPAAEVNARVWRGLYAAGANDLRYPSEVLVRLGFRLLRTDRDRRVLDFGFGTGANLLHFAGQGLEVHGVEISEHALNRTRQRLASAGLTAQLQLIEVGQRLPYAAGYFDVAYAWHVLYYNDREGWSRAVRELERVTKPGGLIIIAIAAPGDVSQLEAESLGNHLYRSQVSGQEGCLLLIPDRQGLDALFPGRQIEVGEFGFSFAGALARYWIITYRMPTA